MIYTIFDNDILIPYITSYLPDFITRLFIRKELLERLNNEALKTQYIHDLEDFFKNNNKNHLNIASAVEEANEQHYMVPTEFFKLTLGKKLKYSGSFFGNNINKNNLNEAEEKTLKQYCDILELSNKEEDVLELGCGWGSLSLYMAENNPLTKFTCLSNSLSQRKYIESKIKEKDLKNIKIITLDVNDLSFEKLERKNKFNKCISIEMFEHMTNYDKLFEKIHNVLVPNGKLFVQVFCNSKYSYKYNDNSWMGRNFFTNGTMPSHQLLPSYNKHFDCLKKFIINGKNYGKTSRCWLNNMDSNKKKIINIFNKCYKDSDKSSEIWFQAWRLFFMACEESFNYDNGREWFVSYYLFSNK
jgi:cyclopropane-fatty-acyl-phospholipid synthase